MSLKNSAALKSASPYSAVLTREQFLFYEVRTTARLMADGLNDTEVVDRIVTENLFQYPTEKSVRQMAQSCIRRLRAMGDASLIAAIATQPADILKAPKCTASVWQILTAVWRKSAIPSSKYPLDNSSSTRGICTYENLSSCFCHVPEYVLLHPCTADLGRESQG